MGIGTSSRRDFARVYVQCMQAIGSYWSGYLLSSDCSILSFVIDRTLRWGKTCEIITYKQIAQGVHTSAGETVNSGVYTSRSTIFRSVSRLEDAGFISIARTKSTFRGFEANIFEINCKLILGMDADMLPKITRKPPTPHVSKGHYPSVTMTPPLCQNSTTNITQGEPTQLNPQKEQPTASALGAVQDAMRQVKGRTAALRAAKVTKLADRLSHQGVNALWQKVMLERYPRVPPVTISPIEFKMLKNALRLHLVGVDLEEFLGWAVGGWVSLRGDKLAWLNRKEELLPIAPSLSVLVRYAKLFAKVYADRVILDHVSEEQSYVGTVQRLQHELAVTQAALAAKEVRATPARVVPRPHVPQPTAAPKRTISELMQEAGQNYERGLEDDR